MSSSSQSPSIGSISQRPLPTQAGSNWSTFELRYYHVRDRVSTGTKPQALDKYFDIAIRRFRENSSFGIANSMLHSGRSLSDYSQLNFRRECPAFASVLVALAELAEMEAGAEEPTSRVLRPITSLPTREADHERSSSSGSASTSSASSQGLSLTPAHSSQASCRPGWASGPLAVITQTVANAVGILFLQAVTEEARLVTDEGSAASLRFE